MKMGQAEEMYWSCWCNKGYLEPASRTNDEGCKMRLGCDHAISYGLVPYTEGGVESKIQAGQILKLW